MSEWEIYTGSDEQIEELVNSANGFIVDSKLSMFYKPDVFSRSLHDTNSCTKEEWLRHHFKEYKVTKYLLMNPHPLADMIWQWARTGQPVWVKQIVLEDNSNEDGTLRDVCFTIVTTTPDWNIPGAEYSFTPFEEVSYG